jgi:hypothetical protein
MVSFKQLADECYRVTAADFRTNSKRIYQLVMNRMAVSNIMTRELGMSTVQVGKHMNRHHTSVVHHRNEHYARYKYDQQYKNLYDKLCNFILSSPNERYELDNVIMWVRSIGDCAEFAQKTAHISCE